MKTTDRKRTLGDTPKSDRPHVPEVNILLTISNTTKQRNFKMKNAKKTLNLATATPADLAKVATTKTGYNNIDEAKKALDPESAKRRKFTIAKRDEHAQKNTLTAKNWNTAELCAYVEKQADALFQETGIAKFKFDPCNESTPIQLSRLQFVLDYAFLCFPKGLPLNVDIVLPCTPTNNDKTVGGLTDFAYWGNWTVRTCAKWNANPKNKGKKLTADKDFRIKLASHEIDRIEKSHFGEKAILKLTVCGHTLLNPWKE